VIAFCRRFMHNCWQPSVNRLTSVLAIQELDNALMCCVKLTQKTYQQELRDLTSQHEVSSHSSLKELHPFIDHKCILRVGGRLQKSTLPFQSIHQVILPSVVPYSPQALISLLPKAMMSCNHKALVLT
jgi:hypothetical protein